MDAVVEKASRKKPLLRRKGAPTLVIAVGGPPPKPEMEQDDDAPEGLVCPKCGAELADTPENREYASARSDEMDDAEDE